MEARIVAGLCRYVDLVQRRAGLVIGLNGLVLIAALTLVVTHLGVDMDHRRLLPEDAAFRENARAFERHFPSLDESLLVVVDAPEPDAARDAARELARRMRANDWFEEVYTPGLAPFFQRRGLLYRSVEELDALTAQLARMQPLIAELAQNPSLDGLSRVVRLGVERGGDPGLPSRQLAEVLERLAGVTSRAFHDRPLSLSWEDLMLEGTRFAPRRQHVIIAEPRVEYGKILWAGAAIEEIHALTSRSDFPPGIRVRVTGNPALNYEEMIALGWDIGVGGTVSFLLVLIVLYLALRSARLVVAAATTLITGLVWTAAFATLAIGSLNVLSITFAVLFIGLGVDFAIHLGMHLTDVLQGERTTRDALLDAVQRVSVPLLLCTMSTAIGFLAFTPTAYRGVAELGLISGAGMFIIAFHTFTLYPALVRRIPGSGHTALPSGPSRHVRLSPSAVVRRHPATLVLATVLLAALAAPLLGRLRLDVHVINLRDPGTESVQAFQDLLEDAHGSPWSAEILAESVSEAERIEERMETLDRIETAITIADYVPDDQKEKIAILEDAAFLFDTMPAVKREGSSTPAERREAVRELRDLLEGAHPEEHDTPLAESARRLRDELSRFLDDSVADREDTARLEEVLLGGLPDAVEQLRRALSPPPIRLEDLPESLRRRMLTPDGYARVQVLPRDPLSDIGPVERFVDAVRQVAPDATGIAVNLVEFGRLTVRSLKEALLTATLAILVLLLIIWRRIGDTLLVLGTVLLAAELTAAAMVLLGLSFNFVNIVVLPLFLGIGVDSGIHLVNQSRKASGEEDLLGSVTARAVLFSAVTTIASFGTLAFSGHRGVASLGMALVLGMGISLYCNLVFLPAALALRTRRHR